MTKDEVSALLQQRVGQFYIYILYRPDGTPFYVGKGKGRRVFFHEAEALGTGRSHKLNVIRSIVRDGGVVGYDIPAFYEDESECHRRETEEILRFGRHDLRTGPLTNLTSGGEGTSGLSEETRQRIDAELHGPGAPGERGIANRFYLELCASRSVPVRPLSMFRPKQLVAHRSVRSPTPRMAAALCASAIANRVLIEPGCKIPRALTINDTAMCIENGVGADILKAGLASLIPAVEGLKELFTLNQGGVDTLLSLSDRAILLDAGVLLP